MERKLLMIICMFATLILGSCSLQDDNDIFGDSSANRITAAMQADKAILSSAKNGWLMEYYPSSTEPSGGYNVLVSFSEDGIATLSSELYNSGDEVKSLYSLKQSAGPILSFDTYNEIMHIFSAPTESYGGDFEFTIMSASAEQVVLSGKKTNAKVVMTPMPENKQWSDYLDEVVNTENNAFLGTYNLIVNDKKVAFFEQTSHSFEFTYTDKDGNVVNKMVPFMYTPEGLKYYEPLNINGIIMENFTYDVANVAFTCSDTGVSAKLEGVYPDGYKMYTELEGTYTYGNQTVELIANDDNKTYTIKGLSTMYDIQASYVRKSGSISILFQYLGKFSSYSIYLCPWDTTAGYLTWSAGSGLEGINSTTEPFTITFKDNGVYGSADSFLAYAFTGEPAPGTTAGTLERIRTPKLVKSSLNK